MRAHPDANQSKLGNAGICIYLSGTQFYSNTFKDVFRFCQFIAMDGKRQGCGIVMCHILHNHIDLNIRATYCAKDFGGDPGHVGYTADGQLGFIAVKCDARNNRFFHIVVVLQGNQCTGAILKAR